MTNNIERRLKKHRVGKTRTTRNINKIDLIYREEYEDFQSARKRELYFKTAASR